MADDATRAISLEKLLERTRQKHKKDIDRLQSQLRRKDARIKTLEERLDKCRCHTSMLNSDE